MKKDSEEAKNINTLRNMCNALHLGGSLQSALDNLTLAAAKMLEAKGCSVKLLDETSTRLDLYSLQGLSDTFLKDTNVCSMFDTSANQEAIKGKPTYIKDVSGEKNDSLVKAFKKAGIMSLASVPLKIEEKIIGVFSIYYTEPCNFTKAKKLLIESFAVQAGIVVNFTRSSERMETLMNVARAINSSLDPQYVLNEIVNQAATAMKCKGASIRLLDEVSNKLVFKASHGLSKKYLDSMPQSLEQSKIDTMVLENNEVIYVSEMETDPNVLDHKAPKSEGIHSMLCAPLTFSGKAIGILKVYTAISTQFTKEEIQFLRSLGELGAMAIRNASLHGKIHSLYKITTALSSTLNVDQILDTIASNAANYLSATASKVLLWDKEKERFTTRSTYYLDQKVNSSFALNLESWCAQETLRGNTIIINNVEEDEQLDMKRDLARLGIKALISVPMKNLDRVTGILQIYCKTPRHFSSDEIEFLMTLATHGAVAIENAKVHEHFKNEYDRLIDDIYVWHDWTSYVIRE